MEKVNIEKAAKKLGCDADKLEYCDYCDGYGGAYFSCCGDKMPDMEESDICPTCHEHCGDEMEECFNCGGTGVVEI
jgi:hypothetical protein